MWVWWRKYCLVGLLIVCWFGFGLLVGWLLVSWFVDCLLFFWLVGWWLGVWLFVGFIDCLLVCWLFVFFWWGCCCIRQAVPEVGLKVQVALWPTWALPASPLRRNTRLTWSPTTSLACLCLGICVFFCFCEFVQHRQPAPWEGISASFIITTTTNLQIFKTTQNVSKGDMSFDRLLNEMDACSKFVFVPSWVVEGVLVKQFGTGTILLMNPTNVCTTSRPRPKSQPKLSAKYLVIPAFIHHTTPCQRHKKTITCLFSWLLLLYDRAALLPVYKCWSVWGAN